ncbi:hypothetical protein FGG78_11335 [Thioclava sp. BHET1]|nr:hypothetical protein FGG78_11335 [Thioclava sp. BHET1]
MMRAALISAPALALAACGSAPVGGVGSAPGPLAPVSGYVGEHAASGALVVTRTATPFGYAEGAEARRMADQICGGRVASSINDHYRDGAWVFPEGCA